MSHDPKVIGAPREDVAVRSEMTCPRCGRDFAGDAAAVVAEAVVEHARVDHQHRLDQETVLAHLEGVHPQERDV